MESSTSRGIEINVLKPEDTFLKSVSSGTYSTPPIFLIISGRFFFIELAKSSHNPSNAQFANLREAIRSSTLGVFPLKITPCLTLFKFNGAIFI